MNCPDCMERMDVVITGPRVECAACKRSWHSPRLDEVLNHMTDQMTRHFKGIVNHMDFDASCVETTEKADV